MNSSIFEKGDILEASENSLTKGYHPIIYLAPRSSSDFLGAMITHETEKGNFAMAENHFEVKDENNKEYDVTYDDSYLVKALLVKFEKWGPFRKSGKLTISGTKFVDSKVGNLLPETFANYFRKTKI